MSDKPDNIVAIETRFAEAAPVEVAPRDWLACEHKHTWLDEKLRTVGCRDCGEERLDPFEVLVHLARTWQRWHREAEGLRKLNAEYKANERDKWERARDRHLAAHPNHADTLVLGRNAWQWTGEVTQPCRSCYRLEVQYRANWYPAPAPEPPPGKLTP